MDAIDLDKNPPAHFLPLGYQRLRLVYCLNGPRQAVRFDPKPDADIFAAFRDYVDRLSHAWAGFQEPITISILAAAKLLCGDLAAADTVVDQLPAEPHKLPRYGQFYVMLLPQRTFAAVFPLPSDLRDPHHWLQGSPEQAALHRWLADHRERLVWSEVDAVYRLD
jgi:hypothetical protein